MENKFALAFLVALLITRNSLAQDPLPGDYSPEKLVDEIFPVQDLDINYEESYENLMQVLAQPIDLNRATVEQLRSLFVLSEKQLQSLVNYRQSYGPFLSMYELQAVPDVDLSTCHRLAALVTVEDASANIDRFLLHRILTEKSSYLITRYETTVETKKAYRPDTDSAHRYAGSPGKVYLRLRRSRPGDFSFGFTAEKDAGEAIQWNPPGRHYGMDYYSFHGQLANKGKLKNLIVGDYLAQFGQGLILGGGFGMGKGSETISTIRRSNLGFIPYSSVNEFGFFRGVAVSFALRKDLTIHAFVSTFKRDALIHGDSITDESSLVSSFGLSGYHRTAAELATRKQIRETNFGVVVSYAFKSFDAGMILHQTSYSLPLIRTPAIYNRFYFAGTTNINIGGYLNYSKNNIAFFSEVAKTIDHGMGLAAGFLASVTPRLDLSLLYRSFGRNFYSFYSNAVSENTSPQNESGVYWGLKFSLSRKYSASGYLDLFRFPWLRYRGYAPSDGSEWLVRLNYQPSKRVLIFAQAREEVKSRNLAAESALYRAGTGTKRNYWINFDYAPNLRWSFKTRLQMNSYRLGGIPSRGMVILQDVSVELGRFGLSARYALFDTDTYDNRIYVYERDVALALSFPAYDGVGVRRYLLVQYHIGNQADLWLRWSSTCYSDRESIGTGGDRIEGNERNDIKLQLRIRL